MLTPYYHDMRNIKREKINHDILFWGAMYRAENYDAAIWFIDNVMPLLEDTDIRFIVAGNRPPEILKSRKNRTSRESIFSSMEKQTAKKFIFRLLLTQAE